MADTWRLGEVRTLSDAASSDVEDIIRDAKLICMLRDVDDRGSLSRGVTDHGEYVVAVPGIDQ